MPARFKPLLALALCALGALTGCHPSGPAGGGTRPAVTEISGTREERIQALSRQMTSGARERLLGTVLDVHLRVEQLGDGNLGPSDFRTFGRIRVLPTDVVRWASEPGKLATPPPWTEAPQLTDHHPQAPPVVHWWIKKEAFPALKFYEAQPVFMNDGWIAVSPQAMIYFRTMTR